MARPPRRVESPGTFGSIIPRLNGYEGSCAVLGGRNHTGYWIGPVMDDGEPLIVSIDGLRLLWSDWHEIAGDAGHQATERTPRTLARMHARILAIPPGERSVANLLPGVAGRVPGKVRARLRARASQREIERQV